MLSTFVNLNLFQFVWIKQYRGIYVDYTQEKNIYHLWEWQNGAAKSHLRISMVNRRSEKRERERETENGEKGRRNKEAWCVYTRTFTSNMRKQCVKSCMDRGSFLEKANLFWWESHIRVVVAVYANRNEFSFISAFLIVSNKVYTRLRHGANIAFEQKYLIFVFYKNTNILFTL